VTGEFGDFATNSFFVWTQQTTIPYKGFPRGRSFNFVTEDMEAIKRQIPEIDIVAPKLQGGRWGGSGDNVIRGKRSGSFSVNGDYPEFFQIDPVEVVNGRQLNKLDIDEKRKIAIIGTRVRELMFDPEEDPIGQQLKIQEVYFTVVGVVKPKGNVNMGSDKKETIWIPFSTLQQVYNYGNVVGYFAITSKADVPASVAEVKVRQLLAERHQVSPEDDMALGGFNIENEFKKMTGLFMGINSIIWIVGIGTLLAGIIGISNIMLVVIKERTKEIGVRRAIGATPINIISQIMMEAIVLTFFSGIMGLLAGIWILEAINPMLAQSEDSFIRNPEVHLGIAFTAIIVLVITGTFAGFLPAKRAIKIKAIDALRDE
jgi:putative ABC transport system permease protein